MFNMPNSPLKQKLSPQARRDKAARDLAYAKTPARRAKKADAQARRRRAKAEGKNVEGKDFDHRTGKFTSVAKNRGNSGNGTKKEGGKSYFVKKHS
jgi:hypothetical protein